MKVWIDRAEKLDGDLILTLKIKRALIGRMGTDFLVGPVMIGEGLVILN